MIKGSGARHWRVAADDYEENELVKADADIAKERHGLAGGRQVAIFDELERDGHDTVRGRDLLNAVRGTLNAVLEHRQLIAEMSRNWSEKGVPKK